MTYDRKWKAYMQIKVHKCVVYSKILSHAINHNKKRNTEWQTLQNSVLLSMYLGLQMVIIFSLAKKKRKKKQVY